MECRQKFSGVRSKYEELASKVPKDQYYRLVSLLYHCTNLVKY